MRLANSIGLQPATHRRQASRPKTSIQSLKARTVDPARPAFRSFHGRLPPPLTIGERDSKHEREANLIAERVVRLPSPLDARTASVAAKGTRVQGIQPMCSECEEEIQRQPTEAGEDRGDDAPPEAESIVRSLRGSGSPLQSSVRGHFDPRFGHDFGGVRVHTGDAAVEAAGKINARAFTLGTDIVFGAGQYAPGSERGRRLLAHELTHVLQQGNGQPVSRRDAAAGRTMVQRKCGPTALGSPAPDCTPNARDPSGEIFYFEVNCDDLKAGEMGHIATFASSLRAGSKLKVHGYASTDGPVAFNWDLSCHRGNKMASLLRGAASTATITDIFKHGPTPGPAFFRRSAVVETEQPPEVCGPDSTDWLIRQVSAAKTDPAVVAIRTDLADASRAAARRGLSAERIFEGAVMTKVLQAERAAGSPRRTAEATAQLGAATPGLGAFRRSGARASVGSPFDLLLLGTIRRAALRWKGLVGTGKRYDFKNDRRTMRNPTSTNCPVDCGHTITLCPSSASDCFRTDVPGNLFYAHVGRFVGWTELVLQLGSQFAQLDSTATWDPPEDTRMIAIGFALPDPLTRSGLCAAIASNRSSFTLRTCSNCSEVTTAAVV